MLTVFYDGKCGLCSREIAHFQKRQNTQNIVWHDIAHTPAALGGTGLSQSEALLFMRVRDDTGTVHSGVDAFIALWDQFPGWKALARLLRLPIAYQIAQALYHLFAHLRFRAYPHCRLSLQNLPSDHT
ncbi:thiol-disulfide oxidoreductase DCC family protein [Roseibium limicola]|uniref:DUF393 domain-containing protein n=1 Tax=Roseibium limicola TaxID=2816037 RepID=A0A939EQ75_9HYPH|nr:DUF393 domain-containing protein [Roseibium limicola]MBO0346664.1 DUF393 domain-containing protein [Roseibium limicola]